MIIGGKMLYEVDGQKLEVIIIKKNNKNTYIRIKEDMKIYVTTNYFTTKLQIKKLLNDNYPALVKMLNRVTSIKEKEESFYYLGSKYDVIFMKVDKVEFINHKIYVTNLDMLNKWLKKQTKEIFEEHLNSLYNLFEEDIPYPKLKIRKMKTRWGVCNIRDNSVTLNSELMKYSLDKLDYVIVHELSHFIHFNHSKDFWSLVSKYCQNYKQIRKEMRN